MTALSLFFVAGLLLACCALVWWFVAHRKPEPERLTVCSASAAWSQRDVGGRIRVGTDDFVIARVTSPYMIEVRRAR